MKKWLLILGMITCMLGITACGAAEEKEAPLLTAEEAETVGQGIVESINQCVVMQMQAQYTSPVDVAAIQSWESAAEDMGDYVEVMGIEAEFDGDDGVIDVRVKGSMREAIVEIVYERGEIASIATNVEYTFGEKMEKAFLNMLLGMGTVFCVLILISVIISLFGFIPKIQEKFTKKPAAVPAPKAAPVAAAAPVEMESEELSDDLELAAVISAAIAAYEGTASADGFVVRSIKRSGKWQRARV
ncbi:MAG: OadG family protein [Clostridium sp.]|nr:OadG family protein [Clostridium sp.]